MGHGRKRGELIGEYHRRLRGEMMAGSNSEKKSPRGSTIHHQSSYYSSSDRTPDTKAEVVMHGVDWSVIVVEPFVILFLLYAIPGLGLVNMGASLAYLGSRLYHTARGEQVGKPIEDFLVSTWQKFQSKK